MTLAQLLQVEVRATDRQASGDTEADFELWELEREMWWATGTHDE